MAEHGPQPVQGDVEGIAHLRGRRLRPKGQAHLFFGGPLLLQEEENQQLAGARGAERFELADARHLDQRFAERAHPQRPRGRGRVLGNLRLGRRRQFGELHG